ncbi:MAG: toll/interleukin-1 receptor domain-containing protein [Anaerolineaceae bacterium]|nr:toll/interleukin-1 receptor domain-containing protein [Anaerolineaceae bacterium]
MSHIFISYSKQNIDFVRYFRTLLEAAGFAVWVDEARLTPSVRWWKSIEQNIETCAAFIVVMSPDAAESDWVEREILLAENLKRPIYPVLLAGTPWSRLANLQYEDMRAGLHARLSPSFAQSLRVKVPSSVALPDPIDFIIEQNNITKIEADVLAFKYAHRFYGADGVAADILNLPDSPLQGEPYLLVETGGLLPAKQALFVETPQLRHMGYAHVRAFAEQVLAILAQQAPDTRHLAMTIHGPGFGLDETESLISQFEGYRDAIQAGRFPPALERITIVELSENRTRRLQNAMEQHLRGSDYAIPFDIGWFFLQAVQPLQPGNSPPPAPQPTKPHAFVVMALDDELDDIFHYGVQSPIHAQGLLCEHLETNDATGDLLEQSKQRIAAAKVIIVDLTHSAPLTYLQLGYAWGAGCPTLLIAKQGTSINPMFEHMPIIRYERIKDLEQSLSLNLDRLKAEGQL